MGFNPTSGLTMAINDRMLASDKLHVNAMNNAMGPEQGNPFQNMPFFLPSMNGSTLQNMTANNVNSMATAERASSLHPHCPADAPVKQREGATNRNSKPI